MPTHSLNPQDLILLGGPNLVYVREVSASEVIAEGPAGLAEQYGLQPDQTLYAVHRGDGARLAVLGDRDAAFAAALAHELAPVSVH